jgi:hypothetical protein
MRRDDTRLKSWGCMRHGNVTRGITLDWALQEGGRTYGNVWSLYQSHQRQQRSSTCAWANITGAPDYTSLPTLSIETDRHRRSPS